MMHKQMLRTAGRNAFAWVMAHKVAAAIVVFTLAFFLWPRSTPKLRGVEATSTVSQTQLSDGTSPTTKPQAPELGLYAPEADGAEPGWSLPAELSTEELQRLARQVDQLAQDLPATAELQQQCFAGVNELYDDRLVNLFWTRLRGPGFKDKNLPLDWYEVVKERNSVVNVGAMAMDMFANVGVQMAITVRMSSVRVRIIGGKVLVGDLLFVKSAQAYIDNRKPHFERLLPLIKSVTGRVQQEFGNLPRPR